MYVCMSIETIFRNEVNIQDFKCGFQNISCDHRGGLIVVAILARRYRTMIHRQNNEQALPHTYIHVDTKYSKT